MPHVSLRTSFPGPKSTELAKQRQEHIPQSVFQTAPIFVAKAHGALVEDVDGNIFIDFAGGLGCLNAGHTPETVVAAVKAQADKFLHTCFHVGMNEPYLNLAKKLNQITPGKHAKKTMFVNSGAEAVENAVKIARNYTKRQAVIAFEHGFHGRTLLTMSLTSKVKPYKLNFGPFAPEVYRLPYPYTYRRPQGISEKDFIKDQLKNVETFFKTFVAPETVAAIIFELVTGEGGFIVMPPEYLEGLAKICQSHGILLIADEVQTGFARTGKLFASDHYPTFTPDILTMAKSLSSGMPLGAVTGRAEIMDSIHVGGCGGTFGGNPLSCAAALATIDEIESKKLSERSQQIGDKFVKALKALQGKCPWIGEVRGLGAMVGIELVKSAETKEPNPELTAKVCKTCWEKGLMILSAGAHGNVVRTLMPLPITDDQFEEGLAILTSALANP
jgi:4-aminobutyrate aminotransferase / (S)-3-amino-2-methylpropionate transaminase / 5-aminovalerate transaminase